MSEKFISYDNLKQYDEFLDKELNSIKDTVDKGFTFNVKYAESNEIGGAALKAISDENSENIAEHFDNIENDVAINKTTLGYIKKNLFDWKKATWLNPSGSITVTKTDTNISVTSKNLWASATYKFPTLEVGRKYTFSVFISNLVKDSAAGTSNVKIRVAYDLGGQKPVQDFNLESDGNYEMTFTPTSSTVYVIFYPNYSGSMLTNSFTASEIMLRYADTTDDTYEPYIGSVDERLNNFTSDIVSLGTIVANDRSIDKTTLGYQKKNLFDWKNAEKVSGVVTFEKTDTSISVTSHGSWDFASYKLPKLEIGREYTFSATISDFSKDSAAHVSAVKIALYNSPGGGTLVAYANITKNGEYEIKFTPTSSTIYVLFYPNWNETAYTNSFTASDIMLRYSDIIDDTYEPYIDDVNTRIIENKNNIAINKTTLGYTKKNLLKNNAKSTTVQGVTITVNDNKSITVSGTNTGGTIWHNVYGTQDIPMTELKIGQSYILSGTPTDNLDNNGKRTAYLRIEKSAMVIASDSKGNGTEFTVTSNVRPEYVILCISGGADYTDKPITFYPMIRHSDITDDTYEPYVESVNERLQNFIKSGSNAKAGLVPAPSTTAGTTKYLREDGTWQVPPDNNTHYTSKNVVGSKTATTNTTTTLTNGNIYLNSVENGVVTSAHKISGSGTTTVTSDANGNIIINSTDTNTDTKVTQTVKTDNANYPLLCAPSGQTATATTTTYFDSGVTLNPSTNTIVANISGISAKATADKNGKDITKTYLPLAGGTMDAGVGIKMVYGTDNRYTEYKHNIKMVAPNSGWANGITFYANDGTSLLGSYGAYGNATALNYHYIGGTYDNPLFKLNAEGDGTFKGSCSATSFKTLDTNLISSGSITMPTELAEKVEITINNLDNYSTLYLELTNRTGVVSSNIIPINYLLESTNKYISVPFHADASDDVYDIVTCIMEISASTNKIILQAPTLVGATNVAKCGSLLYKVFKF